MRAFNANPSVSVTLESLGFWVMHTAMKVAAGLDRSSTSGVQPRFNRPESCNANDCV